MGRDKIQTVLLAVLVVLALAIAGTLWKQGRPAPAQTAGATKQMGIVDYFRTLKDHPVDQSQVPESYTEIRQIQVDNCPPNPDGVCGYGLYIFGPKDWATAGADTFYLMTTAGGPGMYYGPFQDDLGRLTTEAQYIKALTDNNAQ